jgi:hypothetical protein
MHVYYKGLNGKDAAWACKKYQEHHVIPKALLVYFDKPNATSIIVLSSSTNIVLLVFKQFNTSGRTFSTS